MTTRAPDSKESARLLSADAQRRTEEMHQALEKKLAVWVIVSKYIERMQVQQDQAEAAIAVAQHGTAAASSSATAALDE